MYCLASVKTYRSISVLGNNEHTKNDGTLSRVYELGRDVALGGYGITVKLSVAAFLLTAIVMGVMLIVANSGRALDDFKERAIYLFFGILGMEAVIMLVTIAVNIGTSIY